MKLPWGVYGDQRKQWVLLLEYLTSLNVLRHKRWPAVVCAWCSKTISSGTLPVSHGICRTCKESFS